MIGLPSSNRIKPRIADGDRATVGDFPWHAFLSIKYRNDNSTANPTYCSGAILNERWILTSAQCLIGASAVRVDIGSIDVNIPLRSVYPAAFVSHPMYDNSNNKFLNNIALLRLSGKNILHFSEDEVLGKLAPVRLPRKSQMNESFVGYEGYFSGFGYPSQGI